jgi:tetratricopeptide (TPR) repeat protein
MRIILLIYFIVFFSCGFLSAQTIVIDSLKNELQKTKEDTIAVKVLNNLSIAYQNKNEYDKAMQFAKDARLRCEKFLRDNPDDIQSPAVTRELARATVNIGVIETYSGNYTEGLRNQLAALKIFEQINYSRGIASCYINMGVVYFYLGNNDEALKNYFYALSIYEKMGDKHKIAVSYNNIGGIYVNQRNYPEALKNLFASLKISEQTGDTSGMANSYNNIGEVYSKQENYNAALKNHLAALKIMESFSDLRGVILSYNNIGSDYSALGRYEEAIECLNKGLELAGQLNYKEIVKDIYYSFSDVYRRLRDFEKALDYQSRYVGLKDSLSNESIGRQMAEMKTKYETEKKDKEITLLSKDKEIQGMKMEKQRTTVRYLIAGFASLILFSLVAFRLYNQKSKTAFERRVSETELKALRSQMNPHFTFNVLNSIQYYIGGNDVKSAELYLNKFSSLIRMILDQSRTPYISLKQEINMLRLYLELEEMLFENKFTYRFDVDKNLETDKILIPGMLIQPIVENAIKHGIEHKKGDALIKISFSSRNTTLLCNVTDNGIGRKAAETFKTEASHRSVATSILGERMEALSSIYNIEFEYRTDDLIDDMGKPSGTGVFMEIPFIVMQS